MQAAAGFIEHIVQYCMAQRQQGPGHLVEWLPIVEIVSSMAKALSATNVAQLLHLNQVL